MTKDRVAMGRVQRRPLWMLITGIGIRALHQVGAALYLASYIFPKTLVLPQFYLWLCLISGFLLFATEWARHREIYRELAGLATFVKLLLFGAAFHNILPATATVVAAFILASICAHAPKNVRHRLLL